MTQHFLQEGSERSRSEPIGAERSRAEPSGAEPNYMIIFMHVMGTSLRGFSYGFRYNLIGHLLTTSWPPSRPLIDPDLESVCCTNPPSRVACA